MPPARRPRATSAATLKVATFNINGINGINGRLPRLLEWLEEAAPDVVCLQELKSPDERFPERPLRDAGYSAMWHGQGSWNGVAVLARDAIRSLHPDERIYTFWDYWRNAWGRNAGLRLDHLLLSPAWRRACKRPASTARCAAATKRATMRRPGWCWARDRAPDAMVNRIATVPVQAALSRIWVNPAASFAAPAARPRNGERNA